ncbi:hypothetical protein [Virgisporangium ochraceum]|uniref:hypothetical protein n=1 Tax=Virgisporangium ochraceum TaxID=65505 RepID=UPI00194360BD|nr:hypothetical protein [Virgisporangium ochraceum]
MPRSQATAEVRPAPVRRSGSAWSRAATVAVVAAVAAVVWVNRHELPDAGRALLAARRDWLVVGTVALVAWWAAWLLLHLACRRLTGAGGYAEAARLAPVTVGSVAVNLLVKSGNLAGLALFAADARRRGAAAGRVTGAYVLAAVFADVAMTVVVAGTAVLWADGRLTRGERGPGGVLRRARPPGRRARVP